MTDRDGPRQDKGVEVARELDLGAAPVAPPLDFRAVFEEGFEGVVHSLRRLGVREADLEDLAHDVFVVAYRRLADYDPTRPVRAWLFGIALRLAAAYRRRAHRRLEVADADAAEVVDPQPLAEGMLADEQRRQLVLEALEALDLDKRAVLVMHDLEGHPMPIVAETLEVPLNTAYSRLRLARDQFKTAVHRLRLRRGEP